MAGLILLLRIFSPSKTLYRVITKIAATQQGESIILSFLIVSDSFRYNFGISNLRVFVALEYRDPSDVAPATLLSNAVTSASKECRPDGGEHKIHTHTYT